MPRANRYLLHDHVSCMAHYSPLPLKRIFIEVRQRSKTLAALAV
jgi:hypothetical protein